MFYCERDHEMQYFEIFVPFRIHRVYKELQPSIFTALSNGWVFLGCHLDLVLACAHTIIHFILQLFSETLSFV